MTQANHKTRGRIYYKKIVPETYTVFALARYPKGEPQEYRIDWYKTLNSLRFVIGKLRRRHSLSETFVCFEVVVHTSKEIGPVIKEINEKYLSKDYTELDI